MGFFLKTAREKNKRDKLGRFSLKKALSARSRNRAIWGEEGGWVGSTPQLAFPIQQQAGSEQQTLKN